MTDKDLIKKCLENNSSAQEYLYHQFADTMMGICYRYTKSTADAEDILQEGFVKVFSRLHQFKNQGELGAWIRRIMVNTALTYLTKHNRYKREMHLEEITLHPVSSENAEIHLDTKELVEIIRTLPIGYQTVFNLVAVEGYNQVEVAQLLAINENTVRSKYSRARSMLMELIRKNEFLIENKNYAGRI